MMTNDEDGNEADKRRTESGGETASERNGGDFGFEVGRSGLATFDMFRNGRKRWQQKVVDINKWRHETIRYVGGVHT